jgi:polysaccharide lyase-like protein
MHSSRTALLLFSFFLVIEGCASTGTSSSNQDAGTANSGGADGATSSGGSSGGAGSSASSGGGASSSGSSGGGGSSSGGGSGSSSGADDGGNVTRDSGGGDASVGQGCNGNLPLCDDFETGTVGSPPNSALWNVVGAKGCSGQASYSITVDSAQSHSGTQSVKVSGGDSCGPLMMNASAFSKLTGGEVYGRFYTRFSTATPFHHSALMALGFAADAGPLGNNTKQYLQFAAEEAAGSSGVTGGMLDWNFNDLTLPQKNSTGFGQTVYPPQSAWTCVEFHTSSSSGAIEAWVNAVAVPGMTYVPGTTVDTQVNSGWNSGRPMPLSLQSIGFGWVDFSSSANTLWFDDIALSSARIGCP